MVETLSDPELNAYKREYVDFVRQRAPRLVHARGGTEAYGGEAYIDGASQMVEVNQSIVPIARISYQYVREEPRISISSEDSLTETALMECYGFGAEEFESYSVYVSFGIDEDGSGIWKMVDPGEEKIEEKDPSAIRGLLEAVRQLEARNAITK